MMAYSNDRTWVGHCEPVPHKLKAAGRQGSPVALSSCAQARTISDFGHHRDWRLQCSCCDRNDNAVDDDVIDNSADRLENHVPQFMINSKTVHIYDLSLDVVSSHRPPT
jgi:hypothetical protein